MKRFIHEFWLFGLKQASASIFGGALLLAILVTEFWFPLTNLHRFDFLFLYALVVQALLIGFRLEEPKEVVVIAIFHVVATVMELFKTSGAIGAWNYPGVDEAHFAILNVPLFAGFMYSAVGSYIARAWRIFDIHLERLPPLWVCSAIAALIYLNFFSHHFLPDIRYWLLAAIALTFGRTWFSFTVINTARKMPFIVGLGLVAFFIWVAENTSTYGSVWLYPSQISGWNLVPLTKMVAWFLLLVVSFVLVALVRKPWSKTALEEK